jgi:tetratricopeptide (TPR) repeat protein
MALNTDSPPDVLGKLTLLGNQKSGPGNYYLALLRETDEVLSVAAACALLVSKFVPANVLPRLQELAKFQSVRTRAFDFFMKEREYDLANAILHIPALHVGDLTQKGMEAAYSNEHGQVADVEVQKFLQNGDLGHLNRARIAAERSGGWRRALPLTVKLMLINPEDLRWPTYLRELLATSNQFELLEQFCDLADTAKVFPAVTASCRAILAGNRGAPDEGVKLLDQLETKSLPLAFEVDICMIKASLLDKSGRFEEANKWYEKQNEFNRKDMANSTPFDRHRFIERVKIDANLEVPKLPSEDRSNYFLMLGFPRSGTTLLENMLASHPAIETFEEIPSWQSMRQITGPFALKKLALPRDVALKARARYYREIDQNKKKIGANIFIEKLPIRSADAVMLEKMFPQKKYILSIRHPYDVVLSCFKQYFQRNWVMDNFTTIEDACHLYDFTMNQWFKKFSLESERVCYVHYHQLVENMQDEVTRVLSFVGTGWDDVILQFARHSDERSNQTPSYSKVRQGVSLGVQTSWRNYAFLFRKPEARQLDRWLKFFGYEGL